MKLWLASLNLARVFRSSPDCFWRCASGGGILVALLLVLMVFSGCTRQRRSSLQFAADTTPCQLPLQQIEIADLIDETDTEGNELFAPTPTTISNFENLTPWELTVEQAVELALANSKVLQKLGGVVVDTPQGATTLYDPALNETQGNSVEAALSAFDAQVNTSLFIARNERSFNNLFFGGGAASSITQLADFDFGITKQTAAGTTFALRSLVDYNRNNIPSNLFGSVYDIVNQVEVRQPLLRGRGTEVNRIAGPNATPGQYNGVLIARVRSDISLADFEAGVRNLVRDVESNYWELYFAYRDLDTKISARESARSTWENRQLRYENGVGRPDDEAQARQQYFNFKSQAQNALTGILNGQPGVLGAERNLRRLLGMPTSDGRVIQPISEPTVAPVSFDWDQSQANTLNRRVELRRQKWTIRQRELEYIASKSLNKWQFDLVGQYGFRGFGDNLFGSRSRPNGSAFDDLINGDLDDWSVGVELGGAIGNRQGHLAIRNAELNLVRERAVLKEQQRQILHDLNAAFTEVDRSMANVRGSFNSRVAIFDELEPKRKRVNEGQDQVFFLLDVEQRAATAESAVHRAVADYNQALLNYAFTSGSLLSRYNIRLAEGEWSQHAQANAVGKAKRIEKRGPNHCENDTCPVSSGEYDQSTDLQSYSPIAAHHQFGQPISPVVETLPLEEEESFEDQLPAEEIQRPALEESLEDSLEGPLEGPLERPLQGPVEDAIEAIQDPPTPVEDVSKSGLDFVRPVKAKRYLYERFGVR